MSIGMTPCKLHFTDNNHFFLFEWYGSNFAFTFNKENEVNGFRINEKTIAPRAKVKP
jgi:hypothetical protein